MMATNRSNGRLPALLVATLALVLVCGCGGGTRSKAGEKWDGRDEVVAREVETTEEDADEAETVVEPEPVAVVPASPSELKGEHVEDVCYRLIKAGFTNVKPREDADLRAGVLHDEGDVSKVTIEGDTRFRKGDEYPTDARVIVEYHTYRKQGKRSISIEELETTIASWVAEQRP